MTQLEQIVENVAGTVYAFAPCPRGPATRPHGVVLYEKNGGYPEFVVHYIDTETFSRWQGTYCDDIESAYLEFARRVGNQIGYIKNKVPLSGQPNDDKYLP